MSNLKRVVRERDDLAGRVVELATAKRARRAAKDAASEDAAKQNSSSGGLTAPERNHMALEIAESKAKIRKLNHQL